MSEETKAELSKLLSVVRDQLQVVNNRLDYLQERIDAVKAEVEE